MKRKKPFFSPSDTPTSSSVVLGYYISPSGSSPLRRCMGWLLLLLVLLSVSGCGGRHDAMVERLEALQKFNQADSVFTSDSAALELADYFDAHGDANERMLAHYLLGRAYTDMGELPKALQAFHEAVEKGSDTNYYLLNRIHQNAGRLYYREYLPELALQEWKKAAYNAKMDKDSFGMIVCEEHRLEAYYQLGKKDSVIAIARRCGDRFREMGLYEDAAYASSILCWYDIEDNKLDSARRKLEVLRGYIDFEKDNAKHIGTFWNYYGTFYQKSGNTDSALICHRKVLHYSTGWQMGEVLGYKGLFQVYKQLGVSDSVSKYAQLYCEANDSSNLFRSANQISQMQAMFNYERNERLALEATAKAERFRNLLINLFLFFFFASIIVGLMIWHKRKEQQSRMVELNKEYAETLTRYQRAIVDIQMISEMSDYRKMLIEQKETELDKLRKEIASKHADHLMPEQWNLSVDILSDPFLETLHKKAAKGICASDDDIKFLFSFIQESIPDFIPKLQESYKRIRENQRLLCVLTKLRFLPSEAAILMDCSQQAMTNMRSRLCKNLFGPEKMTSEFDALIRKM